MSDRSSVRSGGSRGYRRVSSGREVDETLFASKHQHSVSRMRSSREKSQASRRSDAEVAQSVREGKQELVLTRAQLDGIRARSVIVSQAEKERRKKADAAERQGKMAAANARKARMLELEAERKSQTTLTAEEEEDEVQLNATLARAADMRIEQMDQVKTMRRKMMYAQCAKIREAQIHEKSHKALEEKAFEERQDIYMEIDRLSNLKKTEATKKLRERQQRDDASQIRGQIEERQMQRIMEDELLEQEKQQMKAVTRAQEQETVAKRAAHAISSKELLEEVLAANDAAIQQKAHRRQEEKEDDDRILEWQRYKIAQEEAIEAEKEAIKQAKDREFFELASQMKRSMDNRSEQDALRAKRHQQEQERRQRSKERELKARQQQQLRELSDAREEQQQRKIRNMKLLAIADKEEWHKIKRENSAIQERIDEVSRKQQTANVRHQKELREQMRAREADKLKREQDKRDEGERLKKENAKFLRMIEKKKKEILKEMKESDIPDKFLAEVEQMKITLQ